MALILPRNQHTQPSRPVTSHSSVPSTHFRLAEAEDKALNTLLATKTIVTHLKKGETVVLVGLGSVDI